MRYYYNLHGRCRDEKIKELVQSTKKKSGTYNEKKSRK